MYPNREEARDSPCRQSQKAGYPSYINTGLSCWCFCFKNTQREVTATHAGKSWSPTVTATHASISWSPYVWLSPFYVSGCRLHQLDCGIYLIQKKGRIVDTDNLILYSINESMLWGMLTVEQPWTLLFRNVLLLPNPAQRFSFIFISHKERRKSLRDICVFFI